MRLDPDHASLRTLGELTFLAGLVLDGNAPDWGGYSGLIVDPQGWLLAVSDNGLWLQARIEEDGEARLAGLAEAELLPLLGTDGAPLATKRLGDAEAVAPDGAGGLLVAFEREHRIWRYADSVGSLPTPVPLPKGMTALPRNGGVEAVAALPPDRLLLISEGAAAADGNVQGWLRQDEAWSALTLARRAGFRPTDMTLMPGGDLLLLERRFSLFGAAAARLSVIPAATIVPGARLEGREIALLQEPMSVDNFEAVAARPAPDGGVLIYLMSDDNRNPLQRTLLLQFYLAP